ncbi:hypothetical protein [Pradoshia sp.]
MNIDSRLNQLLNKALLLLWSVLGLMFILSLAIPFTKSVFDFMTLAGTIGIGLLLVKVINKRKRITQ